MNLLNFFRKIKDFHVYHYIIILILSLLGFFLTFEFWGETGNIIFKILLFFTLGYFLYKNYLQNDETEVIIDKNDSAPTQNKSESVTQFDSKSFDSINTDQIDLITLLKDSNLSLNSFLLSQFEILFNFFLPQNGYIFLPSSQKGVNLLYKKIKPNIEWKETDAIPNIIKLLENHEHDILIENNLTANSSIMPFYQDDYSPGSVLCMITKIIGDQKIYWVFDAPANGFFNEEELKLPAQVSFSTQYVILNLLKQQTYAKSLDKESAFLSLATQMNQADSLENLTSVFIDFLSRFFEAHKLTIAFIDQENVKTAKIYKTIGQTDSLKDGSMFNLEEGLCGKVIKNQKLYLLDDIEKDGYFIPRFSNSEKSNFGLRAFLAVPIVVNNDTIGMLSLENKSPGAFTKEHKTLLQDYIVFYNSAISRFKEIKKG